MHNSLTYFHISKLDFTSCFSLTLILTTSALLHRPAGGCVRVCSIYRSEDTDDNVYACMCVTVSDPIFKLANYPTNDHIFFKTISTES